MGFFSVLNYENEKNSMRAQPLGRGASLWDGDFFSCFGQHFSRSKTLCDSSIFCQNSHQISNYMLLLQFSPWHWLNVCPEVHTSRVLLGALGALPPGHAPAWTDHISCSAKRALDAVQQKMGLKIHWNHQILSIFGRYLSWKILHFFNSFL